MVTFPKVFSAHEFVEDLGTTPARVNRLTRHLILSQKHWDRMSDDQRQMVLEHEAAHITKNTSNERLVDEVAFYNYVGQGRSLKTSLTAMTENFQWNNPEQLTRLRDQFKRTLWYDYIKNGNEHAAQMLNKTQKEPTPMTPTFKAESSLDRLRDAYHGYDSWGGKGRERREKKRDQKYELEKLKIENDNKRLEEGLPTMDDEKSGKKMEKFKGFMEGFGTYAGTAGKIILGATGGGAVTGMLGGALGGPTQAPGQTQGPAQNTPTPEEEKTKKRNKILLIGAIAVVVVAIIVFVVFRKKN